MKFDYSSIDSPSNNFCCTKIFWAGITCSGSLCSQQNFAPTFSSRQNKMKTKNRRKACFLFSCYPTGTRTPIKGFKGLCPTIRRSGNGREYYNTFWVYAQKNRQFYGEMVFKILLKICLTLKINCSQGARSLFSK